jgi:formate transporter
MDYINPIEVVKSMAAAGNAKAGLSIKDLMLRGCLSGALLGNWMVCLGVVMAMTSHSTLGKIAAAWLPIFTFFAQGFEHSVVNMFLIPTGMMLGAKVSLSQWWIWNQIPVTLGNLVGGLLFTRLFLYWTYSPKKNPAAVRPVRAAEAGEPLVAS